MLKGAKKTLLYVLSVVVLIGVLGLQTFADDSQLPQLEVGGKLSDYFPDESFADCVKILVIPTYNDATGLTASEISKITNAKSLSIDGNNQFQPNAKTVASIEGIGYFTGLTTSLSIQNTELASIPQDIGSLTNLKTLNIGYSKLTEIPAYISQLQSLASVNFQYNQIHSGVENLYGINSLSSVSFLGNAITEIPEGISQLTNLKTLSFAFNRLEELPDELFTMTQLTNLALATNMLTSIEGVQALENLTTITLAYNRIADFTPIFSLSRLSTMQFANQIQFGAPITVPEGATTAAVDVMDYPFIHTNKDLEAWVAVYDKLGISVEFYDDGLYPHYVFPAALASDRADATPINRGDPGVDTTVTLPIVDGYVYLRMEAIGAVVEKDTTIEWSPFSKHNNDITYIIPIRYEAPTNYYRVDYVYTGYGRSGNVIYSDSVTGDVLSTKDTSVTITDPASVTRAGYRFSIVGSTTQTANIEGYTSSSEPYIFTVYYTFTVSTPPEPEIPLNPDPIPDPVPPEPITPPTVIPDPPAPLVSAPPVEVPPPPVELPVTIDIADEMVALSDIPKTGDCSMMDIIYFTLLAAGCLGATALLAPKKKAGKAK